MLKKVFFVLLILFLTTGLAHAQINLEIVDIPNRQASFSAILVGIGLILVGVAVGLPLLKRDDLETEISGE